MDPAKSMGTSMLILTISEPWWVKSDFCFPMWWWGILLKLWNNILTHIDPVVLEKIHFPLQSLNAYQNKYQL